MLTIGQSFPEFELQDQDGATHTRASLLGSPTVVYFYPKDHTSGCTAEACAFQTALPNFGKVKVVGVSPDSVMSHKKFAGKHGLRFCLLADTETALSQACGIWVEKTMYGKKYMGVERTTYLLDGCGVVTHVWNKVRVPGHADEVLAALG